MKTVLHLLVTSFFLLLFSGIYPQDAPPVVRKHDLHFGCHLTDVPVVRPPLTNEEKDLLCGSNARSDSIDILNYAIEVDMRAFGTSITGVCTITFTPRQDGLDFLPLDLLQLQVDSVTMNAGPLLYDYDQLLLNIHLPGTLNTGDTASLTVFYHGLPTPDLFWGGFRYDEGIGYNLGIGLTSDPFPIGRSWYPCFDNFVERSTYDIRIVTNGGRRGYAVGQLLGEEDLGNGSIRRTFRLSLPNPSYLTGIAASDFIEINDMHSGQYGDYPILLVGRQNDGPNMTQAFQYLNSAIDALEHWFGPYPWPQVGYIMTPQGAMEHSTLIAFPYNAISSGATAGMNRLMAHELAHHWWGNITTLACPNDMWIKEGNAEYSAHLFQEYTFGKKAFIEVVKNNHADVLLNAHTDDGGIYHPLSGIPNEYTYGTTTYNKGAAMMHNLRTCLGDSLFRIGMRSVLDTYRFSAIDAQLMQDQLTAATGIDMSHFFNNWIYQPGFASYELDSVSYQPDANGWKATLHVQQKLHHALAFHTNTPLTITFFDENFQPLRRRFNVSGQFSTATLSIPFRPVWQVLNDQQELNLARLQDRLIIDSTGEVNLQYSGLTDVKINAIPPGDSALLTVVHHYIAPDPEPSLPDLTFSNTHYWSVGGIWPPGFEMEARFFYKGNTNSDLDYDLLQNGDSDLLLLWRPDARTPWGQYPFYTRQSLTSVLGRIILHRILPGQYALASGEAPLATATSDTKNQTTLRTFPNPANNQLHINASLPSKSHLTLRVFDAFGKWISSAKATSPDGHLHTTLYTGNLPAGMYWLEVSDPEKEIRWMEKFVKK